MAASQLSVFIENRQGRLGEVLKVLKENNINILSLSLADTTEFGLLRLIVNDPKLAKEKLSANGFSSMLTDILIIKIPHKVGSLEKLLFALSSEGINVEYMYGLTISGESAAIVMKASDILKASKILAEKKVETLSDGDVASL